MEKVTSNSTVSVHYTGRLEDGTVFDSSLVEGREPLTAILGQGNLIPGFENGLVDMTVGEKKTIEILRPIRKLNKKPWEEVITNWEEISKIIEVNKNKIKL